MPHRAITTNDELADLCQRLSQADRIGFDTEFVSEDTYRPELCLIQIATRDELTIVDPQAVDDLVPFWETLADGEHVTIVHAAREEANFSLRAIDRMPANLFDVQLAAGFCSTEYPSSYGSLISRFLGEKPEKGETRTDWRQRPLTAAQLEYAIGDVRHLLALHDVLETKLRERNRQSWFAEEMQALQVEIADSRARKRWRRVSGIGGLSHRSLAIVRELWLWREQEAEQRNVPARRILRDDLIVELARRRLAKQEQITSIRGIQRGPQRRYLPQLAECVRRGLKAPLTDVATPRRRDTPPQLNLLAQFLSPALTSICQSAELATSLAGTASDVRELVAFRLGYVGSDDTNPPALADGWRAELVGKLIDDLLAGRKSIRIEDPRSTHPLAFDCVE